MLPNWWSMHFGEKIKLAATEAKFLRAMCCFCTRQRFSATMLRRNVWEIETIDSTSKDTLLLTAFFFSDRILPICVPMDRDCIPKHGGQLPDAAERGPARHWRHWRHWRHSQLEGQLLDRVQSAAGGYGRRWKRYGVVRRAKVNAWWRKKLMGGSRVQNLISFRKIWNVIFFRWRMTCQTDVDGTVDFLDNCPTTPRSMPPTSVPTRRLFLISQRFSD